MNRELAAAARAFADAHSTRLADIPAARVFFADVTAVTEGAGPGGNALVEVTWRGVELTASSYDASYTPVVGHRVECALVSNQLIVRGRQIN